MIPRYRRRKLVRVQRVIEALRWERTSLVTVLVAEPFGESAEILSGYVCDRVGRGEGDEVTRAVPLDRAGLITLFRRAAEKLKPDRQTTR